MRALKTQMGEISGAELLGAIDAIVGEVAAYLRVGGGDGEPSEVASAFLPASTSNACFSWRSSAQLWVLLAKVQTMVEARARCTLRDLYYQLKQTGLFAGGAADVTTASVRLLEIIGKRLGRTTLSRSVLNITAAPKGFVAGPLTLMTSSGTRVQTSHDPWSIPGDLSEIAQLRASAPLARYFLVVEKHTVFQALVDQNFPRDHSTIVCTGRGFPDMASRAFVRSVCDQLGLVPLALTDFNPAGMQIYLAYKEGASAQARAEGEEVLCPTLRWIGLHYEDVRSLPSGATDPLDVRDKSILRNLFARDAPATSDEQLLQREARLMQQANIKADLDHIGRWPAGGGGGGSSGVGAGGGPPDLGALVIKKIMNALRR
jgi:meiotic recombination protein SPO11